MNQITFKQLNIRLLIMYCVCIPLIVILLFLHIYKRDEWIKANQENIVVYEATIVDCFPVGAKGASYSIVMDLPDGDRIMIKNETSISDDAVTVYGITERGTNYYAFSEGELYVAANTARGSIVKFISFLLLLGPMMWYFVSLFIINKKYFVSEEQHDH
ncbi:hypothetical protein D6853_11045 [Butyrivibrio sp. X503]|uniref:hypothetical protein n=1 Tax=Butyrivibrio sp. X503 TaxID=2364878 RepID=UPI000EA96AB3|nr:hypothetical protein [Butyrivibrio sp. X503]RKM55256.1 hypothetical protein D6853_11045 [Butyrivibrio sp. X503]